MRASQRALALAGSIAIAFASGCYRPHPPGGAYLCSAEDQACPDGQHCTCGLCVSQDSQAACGFTIDTGAKPPMKLTVDEHQPFPITLQAVTQDGSPASGFNGTAQLSSTWGDIQPPTATFQNGIASVTVTLNRETLSPAVAVIQASFAGHTGKSDGVNVRAPMLTVTPDAIQAPFGWATNLATDASVTKVGNEFQMYFAGQGGGQTGIGMATSTDGKTFTPTGGPLITTSNGELLLYSPSVYQSTSGTLMAYAVFGSPNIELATSTDGKTFTRAVGMPLLTRTQCSYCENTMMGMVMGQVTFPQVIADPLAGPVDGGVADGGATSPFRMFFSALAGGSVSIGTATSPPDGRTFTPEPAPILSGDLTGEVVLLSPRVVLDGTIYKMWYSFARKLNIILCLGTGQSTCPTNYQCNQDSSLGPVDTCIPTDTNDAFHAFCEANSEVDIGYATSSDGSFWTKSTKNPVMAAADLSAQALLVSGAIPTDGIDASKGITVYFSPFRRQATVNSRCLPSGVSWATRP